MPITDFSPAGLSSRDPIQRAQDREEGRERLAVIRKPRFGNDDRGRIGLSFTTYISESGAADQGLYGDDVERVLSAAGVSDVQELDGKVAWVYTGGRGFVRFIEIARI